MRTTHSLNSRVRAQSMQTQSDVFEPAQNVEPVFSVSEYLDYVNLYLKRIDVVIEGEITSLSNRKHIYFSISDSAKTNTATCSCALWEFKAKQLSFDLEIGMKVRVTGTANIYKPNGRFTFIVNTIAPVGEGALQKAFEALKKSLEKKGYFDEARKRSIPLYPQKIGLITSRNGDAIKDFRTHLVSVGMQVFHVDSRVEGLSAISDLVAAITYINTAHPDLDVIVLTRGGGSLESLQAFNSLEVAQAIFASRIPVVSAVGHENDVTIADLVADMRASTPTAAGNVLSSHWREAPAEVSLLTQHLFAQVQSRVQSIGAELDSNWAYWCQQLQDHIGDFKDVLYRITSNLTRQVQSNLDSYRTAEVRFEHAHRKTRQAIVAVSEQQAYTQQNMVRMFKILLSYNQQSLGAQEKQLKVSDPTLKLKQGYSITWDETGKIIRDSTQVSNGQGIKTQMKSGFIQSTVTATK